MKKVLKIIGLLSLILIAIFSFTGCVSGVVSEEQYCELFDGVDAQDNMGNTTYYQMRTLVDNTEFNSSIQSKPYCKLDIYLRQSCQIIGVAFIVRSSKNCTLKFTTYIEEENLSTKTVELTSGKTRDVAMFFEQAIECNYTTEFYIEVEEIETNEDDNLSPFQFDSLVIFLQE